MPDARYQIQHDLLSSGMKAIMFPLILMVILVFRMKKTTSS